MSEWIPSRGVNKLAMTLPIDQQFFGPEAGRRIPARARRRTQDIELHNPAKRPARMGRAVRSVSRRAR